MSDRYNGGPAFPAESVPTADGGRRPMHYSGITVRDYFAGEALAGVSQPLNSLHDTDAAYERVAKHCYRMADAMLKARQQ